MEMAIAFLASAQDIARYAITHIIPMDFTRYVLGAGGVYVVINLLLAKLLSGRKIRNDSPDGAQMRREFAASMRTVVIFAFSGAIFIYGGVNAGLISIDESVATRGWLYFAFNAAALIVVHDAWFYWTHKVIHHPKLFRRFHRLHHKSHNPSPWTAYSFDMGEAFLNAIYLPIALFIIPSSSLAIFVFLIHMILRNAIGHCGFEIFPSDKNGRPVFAWMTTVTHHDIHHANAGYNYGLYFSWWDRLMKTEHPDYAEKFAAAVRKPLRSKPKPIATVTGAYLIAITGLALSGTCAMTGNVVCPVATAIDSIAPISSALNAI